MGEGVHPGQGQKSESDPCLSSKWGTQDLVPRETEARILELLIVSCKGLSSCLRPHLGGPGSAAEALLCPACFSYPQPWSGVKTDPKEVQGKATKPDPSMPS